ncbi:MAG TPA: tetratricopeptide repeat protein [Actinomycetota bacterium]
MLGNDPGDGFHADRLERARRLVARSQFELAERELRGVLGHGAGHGGTHALLALCLARQGDLADAEREAAEAVGLDPDGALGHYILAGVLRRRGRFDEAEAAARKAIVLAPGNADVLAALAQIQLAKRRWAEAAATAAQGLDANPDHRDCANLRAFALIRLGRRAEAATVLAGLLARDPENPRTHANQGWLLLYTGDYDGAAEHFREALRLLPTLEWARRGLSLTQKAHNPLYRALLRLTLRPSALFGGLL